MKLCLDCNKRPKAPGNIRYCAECAANSRARNNLARNAVRRAANALKVWHCACGCGAVVQHASQFAQPCRDRRQREKRAAEKALMPPAVYYCKCGCRDVVDQRNMLTDACRARRRSERAAALRVEDAKVRAKKPKPQKPAPVVPIETDKEAFQREQDIQAAYYARMGLVLQGGKFASPVRVFSAEEIAAVQGQCREPERKGMQPYRDSVVTF